MKKWPKPDLYKYIEHQFMYGKEDTSYRIAGAFLSGSGIVEDWGCGTGYARRFIGAPYRGVDAAKSKWNSIEADLTEYKTIVPKILMRHVLEHNPDWRVILDNFLESFTDRAVLILFTRPADKDVNIDPTNEIPTMELCENDFNEILKSKKGINVQIEELQTDTAPYGYECIYFLEKYMISWYEK